MKSISLAVLLTFVAALSAARGALAGDANPMVAESFAPGDVVIVGQAKLTEIYVDAKDAAVVGIAARLLSEDVERVTGRKPAVKNDIAALGPNAIIIGTIGSSPVIDELIKSGKLDVSAVRGQWEASVLATVDRPVANVERALVIAGSDRRGTAFGVFELSEQIGVSPWYWWSDVPPRHRDAISIKEGVYHVAAPSVKYRGIFINDEDWGLYPWAAKTFDPTFGNIGPKTYEKVFELLLRLKANYLWPAMHDVSKEFGQVDENSKLADEWGIVMGASHAEPMNRNNVWWDKAKQGEWNYATNRDGVYKYWEEWAKKRGQYEAVWSVGIRGIHDSPMNGAKDMADKVRLVEEAIADQRTLLAQYTGKKASDIPQILTPYKEVLMVYQGGLKVPDDVTLVWPDDNHGYIRQLSNADERKRSGGGGVYYHISYWGEPEDYLWLDTTPLALIWEEMSKAYDRGSRNVWVVNVGDIKPGEIGMEFFLTMARNVKAWDETSQQKFLADWAARNFGAASASEIAGVMDEYYRLNYASKPEHLMSATFSDNYGERADRLARFARNVERANGIYEKLSPECKDGFFETVLYPVRCSALMNQKILSRNPDEAMRAYDQIQAETKHFNEEIAGGKWNGVMSANSRKRRVYQRPEVTAPTTNPTTPTVVAGEGYVAVEAERPTRQVAGDGAAWKVIAGLGRTGDSIALLPTTADVSAEAKLEYDFTAPADANAKVIVYCIPTHAVSREFKMRYAVRIDSGAETIVDIDTKEFSKEWKENVLRAAAIGTTDQQISAGKHTVTIRPIDPGLVFDKIVVDFEGAKPSHLGPP